MGRLVKRQIRLQLKKYTSIVKNMKKYVIKSKNINK